MRTTTDRKEIRRERIAPVMRTRRNLRIGSVFCAAWLLIAVSAFGHCDTMDGPVVRDARIALEKKDIAPVLKWIQPEHEAELKAAFARTLAVRTHGGEARELADQFFFETLVRVHRAGEGAPYTGLKPAGSHVEPAIAAADRALETGDADALIKAVTEEAAAGIRRRFAEVMEKRKHAEHGAEAGREYVAAYVEFVHYVEALNAAATRSAAVHSWCESGAEPAAAAHEHAH
ncbi:MAG TPA: DUF6448 family protein [Verrucomicrobiota bacterium]|nr:DUF6448 family protein [Verrucomicrobiota bacterium]